MLPESGVFVGVTKMYINRRVYLCNAILVTVIFCHQYSTIVTSLRNNIFLDKICLFFSNLFGINRAKFYLNSFKFDIFIVRCLGVTFFPDTVYIIDSTLYTGCGKRVNP